MNSPSLDSKVLASSPELPQKESAEVMEDGFEEEDDDEEEEGRRGHRRLTLANIERELLEVEEELVEERRRSISTGKPETPREGEEKPHIFEVFPELSASSSPLIPPSSASTSFSINYGSPRSPTNRVNKASLKNKRSPQAGIACGSPIDSRMGAAAGGMGGKEIGGGGGGRKHLPRHQYSLRAHPSNAQQSNQGHGTDRALIKRGFSYRQQRIPIVEVVRVDVESCDGYSERQQIQMDRPSSGGEGGKQATAPHVPSTSEDD